MGYTDGTTELDFPMRSIALRLMLLVAVVAAGALVLTAPWKKTEVATLMGADGETIVDDGTFRPVADSSVMTPHELVRYQMPPAEDAPALPDGVEPLVWEDLWKEGSFTMAVAEENRVGRPTRQEFPDGTTFEDMKLFFMDIADMRGLQPLIGEVRDDLDGQRVRLAGYTTPVGFGENETRFLLVPELGACIHVPPPPPNQIVYVEEAAGSPEMFAPIWVTGTLRAEPVATVLADVGYRLEDVVAEPYR
ncbi:MAG: DUF3299 domain-containing protein [Pseudomonadota bacterium]